MTKMNIDEWVASQRAKGFGMFPRTPGHIVYVVVPGPSVVEVCEGDSVLVPWIPQEQEKIGRQLLQDRAPSTYKIGILRKPGHVSICANHQDAEAPWDQEDI